jgi:hypothetical protein
VAVPLTGQWVTLIRPLVVSTPLVQFVPSVAQSSTHGPARLVAVCGCSPGWPSHSTGFDVSAKCQIQTGQPAASGQKCSAKRPLARKGRSLLEKISLDACVQAYCGLTFERIKLWPFHPEEHHSVGRIANSDEMI